MSRNQIEFANVLCHFGDDKVLLDYLDEIIVPAFTDDTLVRLRGRETPTVYHFYEVQVEVLDKTVSPPLIGISGRFVKDVNLTRTQIELLPVWWTPSLGCFLKLEGADGAATVQPGVQAGGSPAG